MKTKPDYVIEITVDGKPCFVNECKQTGYTDFKSEAETYSTENEARENANAFVRKFGFNEYKIKPLY